MKLFKKIYKDIIDEEVKYRNYPTTALIDVIWDCFLAILLLMLNCYAVFVYIKEHNITLLITLLIVTVPFILLTIYTFNLYIIKPLKYYENKYGSTGLGDKYYQEEVKKK